VKVANVASDFNMRMTELKTSNIQ